MLELYQFEECPHCSRVRSKMTDLGIDYIIRNEPRNKEDRKRLEKISGQKGVPTLVDAENDIIIPDDDYKIILYIEKNYFPYGGRQSREEKISGNEYFGS